MFQCQVQARLILLLSLLNSNDKVSFVSPKCKIVSVPVLQQNSVLFASGYVPGLNVKWSLVKDQDGGNCGYYALNNVEWIARSLGSGESLNVDNAGQQKRFIQFMERALPIVTGIRKEEKSLNWLGGGELERLNSSKQLNCPIIIVEHVKASGLEFSEHVLAAVKEFLSNRSQRLGIVWNSGLRSNVVSMGGQRWIGLVAEHDGNDIKLYYMNSIENLHPDFEVIEGLLCSSVALIQQKIDQPKIDIMNHDINLMKFNLSLLKGTVDGKIFKKYLGCVEHTGIFISMFSREQVKSLGESLPVEEMLESLNKYWSNYVKK